MALRVAVNLRTYRQGDRDTADAFVSHALPTLARLISEEGGGTVVLLPAAAREKVQAAAPEAEVRLADPGAPALPADALRGTDVLLCPLGPLDPPAPPVPGAATGAPLAPRPEMEADGDEQAFAALGLPTDYLLASAEPGHAPLLHALARSERLPTLVLTGPTLAGAHELRRQAEALGIDHRVRLAGRPPARAAPLLLRRARAVVDLGADNEFPLLALEAMSAGVPLVVAPESPAAELAGEAALTAEPEPESLAAALRDPRSEERLAAGRKRAESYSWERTAAKLADAARGVANGRAAVRREPPRVSVVTPSLNMARFLGETVESVLGQDYPHLDYLVMDGGSTDGTVELLASYGDRLRFVSEPDEGQAHAVNRGFRATDGDVFAFLNADDTYRRGAVSRAVQGFLDHPGASVVYGDGMHVDEDGHEIGPYPTLDFDPAILARRCFICQPAAFMARSAVERVGLLDASLRVALDYDLWIRLAKLHRFARVEGVLATSRMHARNKTLAERRVLYREGVELLKRHYGYVPLDWLHGQAQFLLQGADQFFAHSRPGPRSRALALALGVRHNPRRLPRVLTEWATEAGLRDHDSRWDDGWISRRFVEEVDVPQDCRSVRVEGRHEAFMSTPLDVSLHLDGDTVARTLRREHGAFELVAECPEAVRGRRAMLEVVANNTWRPRSRGDRRRLSCVIDSVELG